VEAVAQRVVELLHTESHSPLGLRLVDAATLAAELGVERSWVYAHRAELGAIQLGSGSKPRLRFDVNMARELLARSGIGRSPKGKATAQGRISRRARSMRVYRREGAATRRLQALVGGAEWAAMGSSEAQTPRTELATSNTRSLKAA
jgi:hypothetical protein